MKFIITLLLCLSGAVSSLAADIVELKNGMIFNHKMHQTERVGKCFVCHENVAVSKDEKSVTTVPPGKIKGFGKEWAHKYCKDCHDIFEEGPVDCKGCHKKKL